MKVSANADFSLAQIANQMGLPPRMKGMVAINLDPGSLAAEAGLRRGDVIQEVNRQPVTNESEFENAVRQAGNQPLVLLVNRQGVTLYVAIQP